MSSWLRRCLPRTLLAPGWPRSLAEQLTNPLLSAGLRFAVSHHYGYGLLDAGLLVELAKAWTGTRPQRRCSVRALRAPR